MTITVNGVMISEEAIQKELLNHSRAPEPRRAALDALIVREVLRQEARHKLAEVDEVRQQAVNATSSDAEALIEEAMVERLIEREVVKPTLDDKECKAYYDEHLDQFRQGDLIEASHILFEVQPNDISPALRSQAEKVLHDVLQCPDQFETLARTHSKCTSASVGGSLGQLSPGDTVPEFEQVVFKLQSGEIAPQLVESRFGLHIVRVSRRAEGKLFPFEMVKEQLATHLLEQKRKRALRAYLKGLVTQADVRGVEA
jgi:peptidyl-prolyl cis-trans isomerase C